MDNKFRVISRNFHAIFQEITCAIAESLVIEDAAIERLALLCGGDARRALGALEACAATCVDRDVITAAMVTESFQHRALRHDRDGDLHFDLLSALHKSLRNSDVQAAVYWLARTIEAGGDPMAVARRLVAMAAEDVGLADPMALQVAVAALQAVQFLGLPEGRLRGGTKEQCGDPRDRRS